MKKTICLPIGALNTYLPLYYTYPCSNVPTILQVFSLIVVNLLNLLDKVTSWACSASSAGSSPSPHVSPSVSPLSAPGGDTNLKVFLLGVGGIKLL